MIRVILFTFIFIGCIYSSLPPNCQTYQDFNNQKYVVSPNGLSFCLDSPDETYPYIWTEVNINITASRQSYAGAGAGVFYTSDESQCTINNFNSIYQIAAPHPTGFIHNTIVTNGTGESAGFSLYCYNSDYSNCDLLVNGYICAYGSTQSQDPSEESSTSWGPY
ncbi:hypothetical protein CYY_008346 [Polysphondylium violaceum]|uniref:Carbohydrate binding domain-containing protein n=1 Tax=Polysphondylium violaceum TaxID=133409 RepID=A0A8J4PN75_9MYCE|nr:hypothetical protein CYY_008346 [Polysphondylium violaceum]